MLISLKKIRTLKKTTVIRILTSNFIDALWSPAGEGLTSWLSFMKSNCIFVTFPIGILGKVWCLMVSILDLYPLFYLSCFTEK